jgi:hypothetical protein
MWLARRLPKAKRDRFAKDCKKRAELGQPQRALSFALPIDQLQAELPLRG